MYLSNCLFYFSTDPQSLPETTTHPSPNTLIAHAAFITLPSRIALNAHFVPYNHSIHPVNYLTISSPHQPGGEAPEPGQPTEEQIAAMSRLKAMMAAKGGGDGGSREASGPPPTPGHRA